MMTTRQGATVGKRAAFATISSRTKSTLIVDVCGTTCTKSVCDPANASRQPLHRPHPISSGFSHINAAANANAAFDRPDPGGPVNSHACVIAYASPCPLAVAAADKMMSRTAGVPAKRSLTLRVVTGDQSTRTLR